MYVCVLVAVNYLSALLIVITNTRISICAVQEGRKPTNFVPGMNRSQFLLPFVFFAPSRIIRVVP